MEGLVNHIVLTVPPHQVKPVLRGLLYSIFFHRITDVKEPETVEILDTHIACTADVALEREISAKVEEFAKEFVEPGGEKGELAVVFLQKRHRKGWFALTEELVPWEEHLITLSFPRRLSRPTASSSASSAGGSSTPYQSPLQKGLHQILTFCAERSANVPPLASTSGEAEPLSHQILVGPPPPSELFESVVPDDRGARASPSRDRETARPISAAGRTRDVSGGATQGFPPTAVGGAGRYADDGAHRRRSGSPGVQEYGGGGGAAGSGGGGGGAGGALGYLEQAKDGLRAVGAKAGAVAGWGGRGR